MSRLTIPALDDAPEASRPILDAVNKQLGGVPNMFRLFSSSPAALKGFTSLSGALSKSLDVKLRARANVWRQQTAHREDLNGATTLSKRWSAARNRMEREDRAHGRVERRGPGSP